VSSASPPAPEEPPRDAHAWRREVLEAERRGELLTAFDRAERGLEEHPGDLWLEHRAVLALARAGAPEEAERRFDEYGLADVPDEDVSALRARIAKDLALAACGAERRERARRAAEHYEAIFARTCGYYPAVNAATLWLVAGNEERSRELAARAVKRVSDSGEDSYYSAATEGEANLLLGDESAARSALGRAAELHGGDYAALATTRRQLRLVCELARADPQLLSALAGPAVVHFCGHRIAAEGEPGSFSSEAEQAVAARISEQVARQRAGYAYGSLASGADILWAEALLAAGSEVHIVLPFARPEFIEQSVAPAGAAWVPRFERCLASATSVRYATDDAFLGDEVLFRYGSELAMGLALLRARYLDADVSQLAVWEGNRAPGPVGTSIDIATWRRAGQKAIVVRPTGELAPEITADGPKEMPEEATRAPKETAAGGRVVSAMLFGDVKGFSKLTDEQLPRFATNILGVFATVLRRHRHAVWCRNTWGDAIYVVLGDAAHAAACALDLQEAMARIDLKAQGLPSHLALRLGAHVGPVFPTYDPVLEAQGFMGSHVSRTARLEPVTPPGAVYVTEPFAAALMLAPHQQFACDYVGHIHAAKDYGRLRMYRLRRSRPA
jgi:class 3 adenylate cyclase